MIGSTFALLPPVVESHLSWWVAGAVMVLGLLVYGLGDVRRFSLGRAWAISGVCFSESIRRRVLWITPLAIVGVLLICQLQRPIDEQDAIRQTIKFSLFAAGTVVTITAIILACTNLPKEIDTRVIYTIVTKPTTRLEIVLGKVIGFAKVSATILLIMGIFTFAYLHARGWSLRRDIEQRLAEGAIDPMSRPTYEYWARNGLLASRTFERPDDLQVLARDPGNDTRRWFFGSGEGNIVVPFFVTPESLIPRGVPGALPGDRGAAIQLLLGFDHSDYDAQPPTTSNGLPVGVAAPDKLVIPQPAVQVDILDENLNSLVDARGINDGQPTVLTDPTGKTPVYCILSPEAVRNLLTSHTVYVEVTGLTRGMMFSADIRHEPDPTRNPVCMIVPGATPDLTSVIGPMDDHATTRYQPALPTFRGRAGLYGQQLRGGKPDLTPVALFKFRGVAPRDPDGEPAFELRVRIERSGTDDEDTEPTRFEVLAINHKTGERSAPVAISPESSRTTYFTVPSNAMKDGDFDLYIRNLSRGQYASLLVDSLSMVASVESFDINLFKSLSILWMMSILVVIISLMCSTFLSWPIAIVLTLLLLLGHWGIAQVSDSLAPGIGNAVAQDLFGAAVSTASQAKVVSDYVEAMAKLLNELSNVLPDISQFSAIDSIQDGVTISMSTLFAPLKVLAMFGLPMLVLSYVFLRNKEVAP